MSISLRLVSLLVVLGLLSLVARSSVAADSAEDAKAAEAEITAELKKLPEADKTAALAQRWCAVQKSNRLGSMGVPVKIMVDDKPVFLCCGGCKKKALGDAKATLKSVDTLKKVNTALGKLSAADRELAESQGSCAVMEGSRLGAMGTPVRIMIGGKPVFLCCQSCEEDAQANPRETVARVAELKKANAAK